MQPLMLYSGYVCKITWLPIRTASSATLQSLPLYNTDNARQSNSYWSTALPWSPLDTLEVILALNLTEDISCEHPDCAVSYIGADNDRLHGMSVICPTVCKCRCVSAFLSVCTQSAYLSAVCLFAYQH